MLKVRWAQFFFICEVLTSHAGNYDVIEEANKGGIVLMAV